MLGLDLKASGRSLWFWIYCLLVISAMGTLFASGISDSRVAGFTGLTRPLLIFIQGCNLIIPVFVLVSTVRTLVKEKESNVFEYLLSFPVSLKEYYFSKFFSRFITLSVPLVISMILAAILSLIKTGTAPAQLLFLYTGLLIGSTLFYVSLSFFISSVVKSQEVGLGVALLVWLFFIALLDIALLGLMIKAMIPEEVIYGFILANPIQIFKIAAISLFDPVLSVIGPASYFIFDIFGAANFILYSFSFYLFFSLLFLVIGYVIFAKKDLL